MAIRLATLNRARFWSSGYATAASNSGDHRWKTTTQSAADQVGMAKARPWVVIGRSGSGERRRAMAQFTTGEGWTGGRERPDAVS